MMLLSASKMRYREVKAKNHFAQINYVPLKLASSRQ